MLLHNMHYAKYRMGRLERVWRHYWSLLRLALDRLLHGSGNDSQAILNEAHSPCWPKDRTKPNPCALAHYARRGRT